MPPAPALAFANAAVRIRQATPRADRAVAMCPVFCVQAPLPHRNPTLPATPHGPPSNAWAYTRCNGRVLLSVRAGATVGYDGQPASVGIPYGSLARLLVLYLASHVAATGSRDVDLGHSLSDCLRALRVHRSGGRGGRIPYVRDQLRRLSACVISVERSGPRALHGLHLTPAARYSFWWDGDGDDAPAGVITVSEAFAHEARHAAFPVDLRKVHALRASPLAVDLYCWLTYRLGRLALSGRSRLVVSWASLFPQLGGGYADSPAGLKEFARAARAAIQRIRALWPALQVQTPPGRLVLLAGPPDVPFR